MILASLACMPNRKLEVTLVLYNCWKLWKFLRFVNNRKKKKNFAKLMKAAKTWENFLTFEDLFYSVLPKKECQLLCCDTTAHMQSSLFCYLLWRFMEIYPTPSFFYTDINTKELVMFLWTAPGNNQTWKIVLTWWQHILPQ